MIEACNLTIQADSFFLENVSFFVPAGQYAVLMGKTGSGKTTLLEAVCGLKKIVGGELLLNDVLATRLKPADRNVGLVPQDGALFQNMTVLEHLQFAMTLRRWPSNRIAARVRELASLLKIEPLLDRRPRGLSGGERQRVALGRALSHQPEILCLDEPLSALDDETRADMIALLQRVQKETGVTALHVTHNRGEQQQLADISLRIVAGELVETDRCAE